MLYNYDLLLRVMITCMAVIALPRSSWAQPADEINRLSRTTQLLMDAGLYTAAAKSAERLLRETERQRGSNSLEFGLALNQTAIIFVEQGQYPKAEPLLTRAVGVLEKLRPHHHVLASVLMNLGATQQKLGLLQSAEASYKRALSIFGSEPDNSAHVVRGLTFAAEFYSSLGKYAEAEQLFVRAVATLRRQGDPARRDLGRTLSSFGTSYLEQGGRDAAEPLLKEAVKILEDELGTHDPTVGVAITSLGELYRAQGRYGDAEPLHKRALEIAEETKNPVKIITALNNLAALRGSQGRDVEAEGLYQRALGLIDTSLGGVENAPYTQRTLINFAGLLREQGRIKEAFFLSKRQLLAVERTAGRESLNYADALAAIAELARTGRMHREAEGFYREALAIRQKHLGSQSPIVANALHNVALTLHDQGRHAEAETFYRRATAIWQKAYGQRHISVAAGLSSLGALYVDQQRLLEAKAPLEEALRIREQILGSDHPDVGNVVYSLGTLHAKQKQWQEATLLLGRAVDIRIRHGLYVSSTARGEGRKADLAPMRRQLLTWLNASYHLAEKTADKATYAELFASAFEKAQWIQASEAAQALAQMAVRSASSKPGMAEPIRERQVLVEEWQRRDAQHTFALSQDEKKRDGKSETANARRLTEIESRIGDIDHRLALEFPEFSALARPNPLTVAQAQAQLGTREALVQFVDGNDETYAWVVTKTDARWARIGLGRAELAREVQALRCGLDASMWDENPEACSKFALATPQRDTFKNIFYETLPFDLKRAHALYNSLFGQVDELLAGKDLLVVLSGPLTQLPLQVLVKTGGTEDLRSVRWLMRDHAITVLPAVSSLKALRLLSRPSAATAPLIGFGNPLLDGMPKMRPEEAQWAAQARAAQVCHGLPAVAKRAARTAGPVPLRSGRADLEHLKSQVPLPDTAQELCSVATALKITQDDIYLGSRATESMIKRLSADGRLTNYRALHFATHGAMAGQIAGTSEPGLILTPPVKQTELDDGYLTATEVSTLKLDADWVILSACNTAAGGGEGDASQTLAGLARAFFFAGARAMLASHWAVESPTTVKLVTSAVGNLAANAKIGRAEALRRSMLAMVDSGSPREAHPALWAPFVVVGEGGAGR